MAGVGNPIFDEVDRKLQRHSLRISLDIKENVLDALENAEKQKVGPAENDSDDNQRYNPANYLTAKRNAARTFLARNRRTLKGLAVGLGNLLVFVYFGFAVAYWVSTSDRCDLQWCNGFGMLLIILCLTYGTLIYYYVVKRYLGKSIRHCCKPLGNSLQLLQSTKYGSCASKTVIYTVILVAVVVFLIFDTANSRNRLISGVGVILLMLLGWIFSKHPTQVNWRPVIWGLVLQFIFGLITIRWPVGRAVFQCVANKVETFLGFAKDGAAFIFSPELVDKNVFAFSVLPVIFFFSFMIQILHHLGAMQWVIMKLGWALQSVMGTTLCESLNCAANTFIGMSESPLLIKPYISKLTSSELHAIMCAGFATVSGTVLAAYIGFGAQPAHLLTASVMSAPASLCYSKLFYPETEKTQTSFKNIELEKSEDSGLLDAATKGALAGIPMVLGIIANIVAFVSFVTFLNAILSWTGGLVGFEDLTFEFILSKVFMPLSWVIGVPWKECDKVATLIGLKTVVNEFVAYQKLGEYKNLGVLSARAEAIATFAICGFANPGSIGIMIGALTSLAPEKRQQITGVTIRAFIAGSAVCFLTASIAGMLIEDNNVGSHPSNKSDILVKLF